ncbi:hypothetical protein P8S54_00985 [Thiomicrospira sp. R3]|uniref:hypothetical protein n=1 Tax=Thiomicrospira sp. R3 TaxID=3035472 RepID=UPI00259B863A|nr:hypothetical protein [Thiomicrospira sp. R3]WFE68904.1 hypothetical protein P8S54_00985 [Thiomicrospira sp. R3]
MAKHKEVFFETQILEHLTHNDWLEEFSNGYDKTLALYPDECWLLLSNRLSLSSMRSFKNVIRKIPTRHLLSETKL